MSLYRPRSRQPSGVLEPCLPTGAKVPPCGPDWIHEIKHDGFRVMARRVGSKVSKSAAMGALPRPIRVAISAVCQPKAAIAAALPASIRSMLTARADDSLLPRRKSKPRRFLWKTPQSNN
jgi:hypothetical protein